MTSAAALISFESFCTASREAATVSSEARLSASAVLAASAVCCAFWAISPAAADISLIAVATISISACWLSTLERLVLAVSLSELTLSPSSALPFWTSRTTVWIFSTNWLKLRANSPNSSFALSSRRWVRSASPLPMSAMALFKRRTGAIRTLMPRCRITRETIRPITAMINPVILALWTGALILSAFTNVPRYHCTPRASLIGWKLASQLPSSLLYS